VLVIGSNGQRRSNDAPDIQRDSLAGLQPPTLTLKHLRHVAIRCAGRGSGAWEASDDLKAAAADPGFGSFLGIASATAFIYAASAMLLT